MVDCENTLSAVKNETISLNNYSSYMNNANYNVDFVFQVSNQQCTKLQLDKSFFLSNYLSNSSQNIIKDFVNNMNVLVFDLKENDNVTYELEY
eukprot:Pgem_evm1s12656